MINIKDVTKTYNNEIVLSISDLEIEANTILGLVGNNGAGKTTFLSILLDLVKADTGSMQLNNLVVQKSEQWKSFTGSYINESFIIDFLTPIEYLFFVGKMYNYSKKEIQSKLTLFDEFLGYDIIKSGKYLRELSTGNKKKVGITAAMFIEPLILILDEPHANLDPRSQIILKRLLLQLNQEKGTTILISSHNLHFVSEVCHRILLLENGEIINDEKVSENTLSKLQNYFSSQIIEEEV